MTSEYQKGKEGPRNLEAEFAQNGREMLLYLRKMRTKVHQEGLSISERDDYLNSCVEFSREAASRMVSTLLGTDKQEELDHIFQQKSKELAGIPVLKLTDKNDDTISINSLSALADQIRLSESIDEDTIDIFIKHLFSEINTLNIRTLDQLKKLTDENTIIVAPLSAGLMLIACLSEYLKIKGRETLDLQYTTASAGKKGVNQTYVPADLEEFNTFYIIDDIIGINFDQVDTHRTIMQIEGALKRRYGTQIEVVRAGSEDRNDQ